MEFSSVACAFSQGEKGDMGQEGSNGDKGETGLKGKEGPPGNPGLTGFRVSVPTSNQIDLPIISKKLDLT